MAADPTFDSYADDYERALQQGLSISGEGGDYFASGRLAFLSEYLRAAGRPAGKVMDFGCGVGTSVPLIRELLGAETIVGVDESSRSIERAATTQASAGVTFAVTSGYTPGGDCDVVYCNGVFHHIPLAERPAAFAFVRKALRPGGVFAFWENNPWSPGARYVMSKIPFDRDAIMVWPREARRLASTAGFSVLRTDYLFIFPKAVRVLRPLETFLSRVPLGAQYQVLLVRGD